MYKFGYYYTKLHLIFRETKNADMLDASEFPSVVF